MRGERIGLFRIIRLLIDKLSLSLSSRRQLISQFDTPQNFESSVLFKDDLWNLNKPKTFQERDFQKSRAYPFHLANTSLILSKITNFQNFESIKNSACLLESQILFGKSIIRQNIIEKKKRCRDTIERKTDAQRRIWERRDEENETLRGKPNGTTGFAIISRGTLQTLQLLIGTPISQKHFLEINSFRKFGLLLLLSFFLLNEP